MVVVVVGGGGGSSQRNRFSIVHQCDTCFALKPCFVFVPRGLDLIMMRCTSTGVYCWFPSSTLMRACTIMIHLGTVWMLNVLSYW